MNKNLNAWNFLTIMPKESFEKFVKRQEKKLDKAEKMVEGIKEDLKDKIEEFEMVEKPVKELKKLWEENEEKIRKKMSYNNSLSFISSLPLPEAHPFLLERISNKFLKEFEWKKFLETAEAETLDWEIQKVGIFLSEFLKKNMEKYLFDQKSKGLKEEEINPIKIHLNVKELPIRLNMLGYRNPKKLHLIIEGDVGMWTGEEMEGGRVIVKGNCGSVTGEEMKGGEIIVKGNCEDNTGRDMRGGTLILEGEVEGFEWSAFYPSNHGTIIWKSTKIWENGDWTKEGKEMKKKGKIPIG